jgi:hypothetical protein
MTVLSMLDSAGRRRSPATMPGYHVGRPPRNKGMRYPADPPTVEEIVAVMRHATDDRHGWRMRAMIVVLWRGCASRKRSRSPSTSRPPARIAARAQRQGRPATRGRHGRVGLGAATAVAGRKGRAPGRSAVLRHRRPDPRATVVRRGGPLGVPPACRPCGRQAPLCAAPATPRACARARPRGGRAQHHPAPARHANLGTTSIYLQGIDPEEIIATVRTRRAPMMSASAGLQL